MSSRLNRTILTVSASFALAFAGHVPVVFAQDEAPARQPGARQPRGNANGNGDPAQPGQRGGRRGGQGMGGPGGGRMMGGPGGMQRATITPRNIAHYAEILNLTEDQKSAVDTLFDGYRGRVEAIQQESRDTMREMRDEMRDGGGGGDGSGFAKFRETMESARKQIEEAEKAFFGDVQLLLTEPQAALWPKIERTRNRDASLPRGRLSGENVDLIEIVEDLKLDDGAKSTTVAILDQYEAELDRELTARNKVYDEVASKVGEMFREGNTEAAQAEIEKGRAASVRVRDVQRRYADKVKAVLPDGSKETFDAAFKRASFPRVYRPSMVSRMLEGAERLSDLSADQKAQLAEIKESYAKAVAPLNDRLAKAEEATEMAFNIGNMPFGRRGGGGNADGEPSAEQKAMSEARQAKRELDTQFQDRIEKVLTPAQREKLPRNGRGSQADEPGMSVF